VIASVSLGSERLFRLRGKGGAVVYSKLMPHGSLLIMAGNTQKHFKHEVPKDAGVTYPRINLTFRCIAQVTVPSEFHELQCRLSGIP
jgi:alkylated DNA repair dioxygenase AlkB